MIFSATLQRFIIFAGFATVANGFVSRGTSKSFVPPSQSSFCVFNSNVERIEFKIFPDGRIEETVIGIKGNNCQAVTEDLNAALGKVVSSQPTEEMFEQEVKIGETISVKDGDSSTGWEGASSW